MARLVSRHAPEAVRFAMGTGPTARALSDADEETRARAQQAITEALAGHSNADGVSLGASAWVVNAWS